MDRCTSISFRPRKREAYVAYCAAIGVPEEAVDRVCDGPANLNVPRLTRYTEDISTLVSCQGLCRRAPVSQVWDIGLHADFYSAATGIDVTSVDLLKGAERVWNLQRCFNVREGIARKDEWFPKPLLPLKLGGEVLDESNMDDWLTEYYKERGWNMDTGIPTVQKLESLDLGYCARELEELGLIK